MHLWKCIFGSSNIYFTFNFKRVNNKKPLIIIPFLFRDLIQRWVQAVNMIGQVTFITKKLHAWVPFFTTFTTGAIMAVFIWVSATKVTFRFISP